MITKAKITTSKVFRGTWKVSFIGLVAVCLSTSAKAQSPAQQLSLHVNDFTGDFRYSVPLLAVPGPNGESFPLTAGYSAGIRMDQQASMIGLGWGLSLGEVSRSVNGRPDDWKGGYAREYKVYNNGSSAQLVNAENDPNNDDMNLFAYYGPAYYSSVYGNPLPGVDQNKMDLYVSRHGASDSEASFEFPDYDSYYVSGPGIGGQMQPHKFEYANLFKNASEDASQNPITYGDPTGTDYKKFSSSGDLHFRFRNEATTQISMPWYSQGCEPPEGAGTCFYWASLPIMGSYLTALGNFKTASELSDDPDYDEYFCNNPIDTNDLWTPNVIDWFTNSELDAGVSGFMEYVGAGDRGSSSLYNQDGIGGFKVTDPNGITYHYSLPVYSRGDVSKTFPLKPTSGGFTLDTEDQNDVTVVSKTEQEYASSWKLTGITGPYFNDATNVGEIGEGDEGYWVSIEYGKWTTDANSYTWRSPYHSYHFDRRLRNPINLVDENPEELGSNPDPTRSYRPFGSVSFGSTDLYYPKCVRTATHIAYFVYDVRYDALGVASSTSAEPKLKLTRIVLINKDDESLFDNLEDMADTEFPSLSTTMNVDALVSEEHYQQHKEDIESHSLRTIEFEQDYSLCKGTYDHVDTEVTVATTATTIALDEGDISELDNILFHDITGWQSESSNTESGKLTLKGIKFYEDHHEQLSPGFEFEYSGNNPNYDHRRKDMYGYYKHNFSASGRGPYLTRNNDEHKKVDAWSLTKITTPLGAEISVEYESDKYEKVCADGQTSLVPRSPQHFFLVETLSESTQGQFAIELYDPDGYYYRTDEQTGPLESRVNNGGLGVSLDCHGGQTHCSFTQNFSELDNFNYDSNNGWFEFDGSCACDHYEYDEDHEANGTAYVYYNMKWAYGGGLRVKNISITEPDLDHTYALNYTYHGGVATSEPDRYSKARYSDDGSGLLKSTGVSDRHVKSPRIGYTRVDKEIVGAYGQSMGISISEFENFNVTGHPGHWDRSYTNPTGTDYHFDIIVIHESNIAGLPKSNYQVDKDGQVLTKTENYYGKHGFVDEGFYLRKDWNGWEQHYAFIKKKSTYLLDKSVTTFNDKKTVMEILSRDQLTGNPTKVKTWTNAEGAEIVTTDYAYNETGNSDMGPKFNNESRLNLLNATSKVTTYDEVVDPNRIRNGSFSKWNDTFDYWIYDDGDNSFIRNSSGYDNRFGIAVNRVFNGNSSPDNWKRASVTTLLNQDGKILEQRDDRGRFTASRVGYDGRYAIASVINSNYQGFTHSSFEVIEQPEDGGPSFFDGQVQKLDGIRSTSNSFVTAHSGRHYLKLRPDDEPPRYLMVRDFDGTHERGLEEGRIFHASVWVHLNSPRLCGLKLKLSGNGTPVEEIVAKTNADAGPVLGDWKRLDAYITIPADYFDAGQDHKLRVSVYNNDNANAYFDDLRLHPVDAQMSASVYDVRTGWLTHSLNNDNIATKFEHDEGGNVVKVFSETEEGYVKQVETTINFGRTE